MRDELLPQANFFAQEITTSWESFVQKKLAAGKWQSVIFCIYNFIFIRVYKNVIHIINPYFHFNEQNTFQITNVWAIRSC